MKANINRNDPCHCGSGKKYKNCHEGKMEKSKGSKYSMFFLIGAVVLIGILIFRPSESSKKGVRKPGQVWSEEHNHWHDAPAPVNQPNTITPDATHAPGPAPEGKVWSEEHGHWHNAPGNQATPSTPNPVTTNPVTPSTTRPPGPAPEGKVWSEEHGHWHNATQ